MEKIKIIKIPASKMIKTPEFDPGSESFFQIMQKLWITVVDKHKDIFPRDFMPFNDDTGKNFWLYSVMGVDMKKFNTDGFEIIDFEGGYYATATAIDPDDNSENLDKTIQEVKDWVIQSDGFELDFTKNRLFMSRRPLGDGDDEEVKKALGYIQLEIFIPIKIKNK